jgi:L-alanine-DL-glutamate epimerase-like enolase superfamily enzyme
VSAAGLPAEIHVQSLRFASGLEGLVARIVERDGAAGFGFTLDLEACVARELAGWDAQARRAGLSLAALLGGADVPSIRVERDAQAPFAPDWEALQDAVGARNIARLHLGLWAWGGIAATRRAADIAAQAGLELAFVAPHAHPWELAVCASLAAAYPGRACITVAGEAPAAVEVPQVPGLGVDWRIEPNFEGLAW